MNTFVLAALGNHRQIGIWRSVSEAEFLAHGVGDISIASGEAALAAEPLAIDMSPTPWAKNSASLTLRQMPICR